VNDAGERTDAGTGPRFRLSVYEGPLDLLLHLIKRAELDARDVTASVITEQYLAYLELLDSLNLDVAGEYLVMAATLKRDLVARLLEYQRYREAADKLGARALLGRDVFAAPGEKLPEDAQGEGDPPRLNVSIFDLVEAMAAVLKRLKQTIPREMALRDIPVAECIPGIVDALSSNGGRVEFEALFQDLRDRRLVIATFMALLELIRQGRVRALQERRFGPILLEAREPAPGNGMDLGPAGNGE